MTAEFDTLRHEMNDLAADMAAKGVAVTHKQFAGVDHGFTHLKPIAVAHEALTMIGDHLRMAYTLPTQEERNVAVVRRLHRRAVNGGDLAVIDDTWADDMTWHGGCASSPMMRAAGSTVASWCRAPWRWVRA